jgi:hypothetical protein
MALCFFALSARSSRSPSPLRSPRVPSWARAGVAALMGAASACSGDDGPASEPPAMNESDGADHLAEAAACGAEGYEPCDVLAADCQVRLAEIAACQWGGAGTAPVLPSITVLTRAMVREQLAAQATATDVPPEAITAARAVLVMLGLQQPEFDTDAAVDVAANLLLAQYDPATDRIIVVEDARTGDPIVDNAILFHELVHAQQDARHDLQALFDTVNSVDSLIEARALFEGEAQFHQIILELGMYDLPIQADAFRQVLDDFRARQDAALFGDPASAWNRSLFLAPYSYGPYSVLDTWLEGGADAMVERYDDPSTESLRMLEGALEGDATFDLLDPYPANPLFAVAGSPPPMLGEEAYPVTVDRLGAWTIYVLGQLGGAADPEALALGWRGDQIDIFALDAGGYAGRLRVRFDSPEQASQFESVMLANPNADVRTADSQLVVTLMSEGTTPEWLFGPLMGR